MWPVNKTCPYNDHHRTKLSNQVFCGQGSDLKAGSLGTQQWSAWPIYLYQDSTQRTVRQGTHLFNGLFNLLWS